jgi:hypothetical protein
VRRAHYRPITPGRQEQTTPGGLGRAFSTRYGRKTDDPDWPDRIAWAIVAAMPDPPKPFWDRPVAPRITADEFWQRFGCVPLQDDLQRANCPEAGQVGHYQCGVCRKHDRPRFMCGCIQVGKE